MLLLCFLVPFLVCGQGNAFSGTTSWCSRISFVVCGGLRILKDVSRSNMMRYAKNQCLLLAVVDNVEAATSMAQGLTTPMFMDEQKIGLVHTLLLLVWSLTYVNGAAPSDNEQGVGRTERLDNCCYKVRVLCR